MINILVDGEKENHYKTMDYLRKKENVTKTNRNQNDKLNK